MTRKMGICKTGLALRGVAVIFTLLLLTSACETLSLHATGGNRGVEAATVGVKF